MIRHALTFFILLALFSCKDEHSELPDGLFAEIETSKGTIITTLEFEKTPVTVANFVTLAEGKNPFVSKHLKGKNFFDGLLFHRVIADFMIQGGDPDGNGAGGPGYKFKDEITNLRHDKPGILSMANAGPGTNGSQFFITHVPTPHLDGLHTVFGETIKGLDVVDRIIVGDVIKSVTIIRKGEDAKKFDAVKVFRDYVATDEANQKERAVTDAKNKKIYVEKFKATISAKAAELAALKEQTRKTSTGLRYKILSGATGKKPEAGKIVYLHYSGFLESGEMFDSSRATVAKQFGKYDQRRADANMYAPIPYEVGRKEGLIPGFLEGIEKMPLGSKAVIYIPAHLGYGPQGAGNVIPPDANLIFELEMLEGSPENEKLNN